MGATAAMDPKRDPAVAALLRTLGRIARRIASDPAQRGNNARQQPPVADQSARDR